MGASWSQGAMRATQGRAYAVARRLAEHYSPARCLPPFKPRLHTRWLLVAIVTGMMIGDTIGTLRVLAIF
jgi:hypothetical protein